MASHAQLGRIQVNRDISYSVAKIFSSENSYPDPEIAPPQNTLYFGDTDDEDANSCNSYMVPEMKNLTNGEGLTSTEDVKNEEGLTNG